MTGNDGAGKSNIFFCKFSSCAQPAAFRCAVRGSAWPGANCRCQNFFKKGTTEIKASFRVVLETSPLCRCVQVLVCSERHAKATQDQGKELPALEKRQDFGEQSMKACLQWAPSNPLPFCIFYSAVILGTVEFFNSHPVMHLCGYAWQYVLIFGCRLFIDPDHQLISKIRLPTFPIRPDHPTDLCRGDERLPFSSPAAICRVIYLVPMMNAQASFAHLQLKCIDGPIIQRAGQMRPPGVFWEISQGGEGCTSVERNWELRWVIIERHGEQSVHQYPHSYWTDSATLHGKSRRRKGRRRGAGLWRWHFSVSQNTSKNNSFLVLWAG